MESEEEGGNWKEEEEEEGGRKHVLRLLPSYRAESRAPREGRGERPYPNKGGWWCRVAISVRFVRWFN